MSEPWYSIVLALHVFFATISFGALLFSGSYARRARHAKQLPETSPIRRYFHPGRNLAARSLFLVPVLGAVLLALGHGQDDSVPYPWIGLFLWLIAAGIATVSLWPAERKIQEMLSSQLQPEQRQLFDATARRLERMAGLTTICFVAAAVIMIAQPG